MKHLNGIKGRLLCMALLMVVCAFPVEAQSVVGTIGIDVNIAALVTGSGILFCAPPPGLSTEDFETKMLTGLEDIGESVEAVDSKAETLMKNYDQLDRVTKGNVEDIHRLKKCANDSQAGFDEMVRKMRTHETNLRNEMRQAWGDPAERIRRDPEMKSRFQALIAKSILKKDERLPEWHTKALGEDSSPGSTVIDDKLNTELYDTLSRFGIWNTLAVRPLSTKQTKFTVNTARPVANFILTEATAIADDTNKAGTSVTCEAELIGVLLNVSEQLLEDSEVDIVSDVLEQFSEAYSNRLDVAAFTADGTADATNGGQTGIFQGGTLSAAAATEDTVEELDMEDFTACLLAVDPIVLNRMSKWWMHPHVLVRMLSIKDLDGRPIFQTALEAPSHGAIGSILGYPVILGFGLPSTNTANTRVATFGDPNGCVVGVRRAFDFKSSEHHKWAEFQRSFRSVGRAGTKIRRSAAFANLRLTT